MSRSDGHGIEDEVHECYVEDLPLASIVVVCVKFRIELVTNL